MAPVTIAKVAYAWNSALEDTGQDSAYLDVLSVVDGQTKVDLLKTFKSKKELLKAMEGVIPLLREEIENESRQEQAEDVLGGSSKVQE